ncbi:hypothetical protein PHLCEN_2v9193 [Hermanssonia centrifuga]|uniref:Uncharacterized protein n=1 Tax=Hermanssonia centrifuga TaxID=98765 RepID=A0A2R6NRG2_9APHY|nr:hypothetical protein PHLCEN_2v9193 [Hermanssonia centrifuga]
MPEPVVSQGPCSLSDASIIIELGAGRVSDEITKPSFPLLYAANERPNHTKFPQGTQGFLYYHAPKWAPQLAGQLRFRITPSSDPATFSSGRDLTSRGLPWRKSLFSISALHSQTLLWMLIRDGLVTDHLLAICKNLNESMTILGGRPSHRSTAIIYALRQPFYIHFGATRRLYIINISNGEETIDSALVMLPMDKEKRALFQGLHGYYCCNLSKFNNYPPVGASAICRFESAQYEGKRTVVIRLVKILEPPNISNFPPMAEGDLLRTRRNIWRYKIVDGEGGSISGDRRRALGLLKEYPDASFDYAV